jgi:hypothetical protein
LSLPYASAAAVGSLMMRSTSRPARVWCVCVARVRVVVWSCGVWCVVCGVWCVVCGVRCVARVRAVCGV